MGCATRRLMYGNNTNAPIMITTNIKTSGAEICAAMSRMLLYGNSIATVHVEPGTSCTKMKRRVLSGYRSIYALPPLSVTAIGGWFGSETHWGGSWAGAGG